MTIRQLMKALDQVSIEYKDCLDQEITIDFDPNEGGYFELTPVDVVRSFDTGRICIIAIER